MKTRNTLIICLAIILCLSTTVSKSESGPFLTEMTSTIYKYFQMAGSDAKYSEDTQIALTCSLLVDFGIAMAEISQDVISYPALFNNEIVYYIKTAEGYSILCHYNNIALILSYNATIDHGTVEVFYFEGTTDIDFQYHVEEQLGFKKIPGLLYSVSGADIRRYIGITDTSS